MLHRLIDHNPDLKRLWDEGREVEIRDGYLLIHHVPYLNSSKEIKYGIIVSTLTLAGDKTLKPDSHTVYFIGDHPCHKNGALISQIQHTSNTQKLSLNVTVNHMFSNKPANGYSDYYEKMMNYINIISGPAKSVDDTVTECTLKIIEPDISESVFNFIDTNSTRAEISSISQKLSYQKIGIIGLGGTGSYILDLVAKTPVTEINIFDGDIFKQHNAFRSPGSPTVDELKQRLNKANYFKGIYSKMHRNIIPHPYHITISNIDELKGLDFVFICVDNGTARKIIVDYLININIQFIDVGMGLFSVEDRLAGIIRVTSVTKKKNDNINKRIPFTDEQNDEYSKNIQIADLNSLNAAFAVIKWKKISGFYQDYENENYSVYSINVNQLLNDDFDI